MADGEGLDMDGGRQGMGGVQTSDRQLQTVGWERGCGRVVVCRRWDRGSGSGSGEACGFEGCGREGLRGGRSLSGRGSENGIGSAECGSDIRGAGAAQSEKQLRSCLLGCCWVECECEAESTLRRSGRQVRAAAAGGCGGGTGRAGRPGWAVRLVAVRLVAVGGSFMYRGRRAGGRRAGGRQAGGQGHTRRAAEAEAVGQRTGS